METIESKIINDWLILQGKNPVGEPLFRLIWTTGLLELRLATRRIYEGHIFIREETQVEKYPKYSWIENVWVLEQWRPPNLVLLDELPDSKNGSYEPIFFFESKGQPLPLRLEPVQFLVKHQLAPGASPERIRSAILAHFEEKEKRIQCLDEDELDVSTDIQSNLHFGEAIIVPSNYPVECPNLRNK